MSSFKKFIGVFVADVLVGVLMLRWYAMQFLYRTMEDFLPGLPVTLGATVVMSIIAIILVKKATLPFDRILKKIPDGYIPTDEDRESALKTTRKVNWVIIGLCIAGFFIGQIIVLAIEVSTGVREFHLLRIAFTIVQATIVGMTVAICIIFVYDELISPYRQVLEIHDYTRFANCKTLDMKKRIILLMILGILLSTINTLAVPFEIINVQKTAPVENALSYYLLWGFVSCIVSAVPILHALVVVMKGYQRRIKNSTTILVDIAKEGDLVSRINISAIDDVGELVGSINTLMDQLSDMVKNIRGQTDIVSKSAKVLSTVSKDTTDAFKAMDFTMDKIQTESKKQNELVLAADKDINNLFAGVKDVEHHVQEQSSSVQESSASIAQMAANIASVADMTKKADVVSEELSKTTDEGNGYIVEAVKSIQEIQMASAEVQEIVKTIQKISSQTNLLSMNAAIEAAHAGEFGAGFAVVADEVRSLASSSATSAKDIQNRIKDMVEKINQGVRAIEQAGNAFNVIAKNVEENTSLIQTISRAMEEQQIGAKETMDATAEMVEATQAIRELSMSQSQYAENIKSMMETVVNSSGKVGQAVFENHNASENLVDALKTVSETVNENSDAVASMKSAMEKFSV